MCIRDRNIFLIIGLILFLFVSFNSFGGSAGFALFMVVDPYHGLRIEIPFYDLVTILSSVGSIVFLSVALIGKFKNLPDLTDKNVEHNLLMDRDTIDY